MLVGHLTATDLVKQHHELTSPDVTWSTLPPSVLNPKRQTLEDRNQKLQLKAKYEFNGVCTVKMSFAYQIYFYNAQLSSSLYQLQELNAFGVKGAYCIL